MIKEIDKMSLLNRSSKIFKTSIRFVTAYSKLSNSYIPNLYVENPKLLSYKYVKKVCAFKYSIQSNENNFSRVNNVEHKIMMLQNKIEKGTVYREFLTNIIDDLEINNIDVSQNLGTTLLKCCGNTMYSVDLKTRQEWSKRIWNLLESKNLTIDHYHTLLQTHIDNAYLVDPYKFLQKMTVTPDNNTYCLLLKLLATTDTNKSVTDFLSHMRKNKCLFEEETYNALVYSYAIQGDLTKAKEIIDSMEIENVTPSFTTRTQLMYGYAKTGDVKALTNMLITETICPSDIMKLVKFLSLCKNGEHISDVLQHMQPIEDSLKEVIAAIVQLVYEKHYFDAYKIVTEIPIKDNNKNIREKLASHLITEMINLDINQEDLLKFLVNFAIKHNMGTIWKKAIQCTTKRDNEQLAFSIFEKMKEYNRVIMPSYYWFLLINACKRGEESNIYSIIRHMVSLNITIDNRTFLDYVFPYVNTSNPAHTISKMLANQLATSYTVPYLMKFLLHSYRMEECISLCKKFKKKIDCHDILDSLVLNYKQSKDIDSCIKLILELSYNGQGFASTFLVKFVEHIDIEQSDVKNVIKFLSAMKEKKAIISIKDVTRVERRLFRLNLLEYTKDRLSQLLIDVTASSDADNFNSGKEIHPTFMNIEQLKSHLEILKIKGLNTRGTIRLLLIASCKVNDIDQVNNLLNEIKVNDIKWSAGMKVSLFNFYTKNEMTTKAVNELRNIQSMFPDFKIDNFKIIQFLILLVKKNKIDEAMNVLKEFTNVNHKTNAHVTCIELLNALAEHKYFNYVKPMTDLLIQMGYCKRNSYIFRTVLRICMGRGEDMESIVSEFKKYVEKYNKTPGKQEILTELIKHNSENINHNHLLKEVYNSIVKVQGQETAITNIMISLAQCGKTKELQDLHPTNHISVKTLLREFQYLSEDDIVTVCLILLELRGKKLKQNLEPICNLVLSIYIKRGDTESAIILQEKMLQKGIVPSNKFKFNFEALINKYKLPFSIND